MKNKLQLCLCSLFATVSVFAQTPDKAKLDSYFAALEANNKYMGSVAISKDGKTIYSKTIGYADAEAGKKLNATTKFRIGSISKMFTSALIFKAAEEKKLQLTDKIDTYFPSIPNASKITVEQLLGHRSGIHNFTNDAEYLSYMSTPKTEAEMVAIITKAGSDFEPGSEADYSNSNYVLLTYILEKVYQKPYKELLNEKIVKPLALKNTYYGGKINTVNNEAYSYEFDGKWQKQPETDMSIPQGAGAVVSNPEDISRFIEGLFAGKIISKSSLDQMKTIKDGYGLGMFQIPFGEKKSLGHTGGIDGFTSIVGYFPDDKITVAMTNNGANINTNDIVKVLLSWAYNKPFEIPSFKAYPYTAEELNSFAGEYTTDEMPFGFTLAVAGNSLKAQATGQDYFPLESLEKDIFTYRASGITVKFNRAENSFLFSQGPYKATFKKKQ